MRKNDRKYNFLPIEKYRMKGSLLVVSITQEEKKVIAERFPQTHIRRTVQQKTKRHRYYMEESKNAMRLLKELRSKK